MNPLDVFIVFMLGVTLTLGADIVISRWVARKRRRDNHKKVADLYDKLTPTRPAGTYDRGGHILPPRVTTHDRARREGYESALGLLEGKDERIRELESRIALRDSGCRALEGAYQDMRDEVARLERESLALKGRHKRLQDENVVLKDRAYSLKAESDARLELITELQDEPARLHEEVRKLKHKVKLLRYAAHFQTPAGQEEEIEWLRHLLKDQQRQHDEAMQGRGPMTFCGGDPLEYAKVILLGDTWRDNDGRQSIWTAPGYWAPVDGVDEAIANLNRVL